MGSWSHFADILMAYGYPLILPLAVIEGPVVAIVAGFLAAQGYLAWYWALGLLVGGDLIGDAIYYAVGRFGRVRLEGLGRRFGLSAERSRALADGLKHNSVKMLLVGKWTHAIGAGVLVGAGMLRLPLPKFLFVNLLATLPKCAVLLGLGYFAGSYQPLLARHAVIGSVLLFALGAACIAAIVRRGAVLWAGGGGR
jgi:membrane protein DedA with SNARE-associated domain